jgi:hypothetical protein
VQANLNNVTSLIDELLTQDPDVQVHLKVSGIRNGFSAELVIYPRGIETPLFDPRTGDKPLHCTSEDSLEDALYLLNLRCAP